MRSTIPIALAVALTMATPRATHAQILDDNVMLDAYGAALGSMLYNSYISIGAIADGYVADAYDSATLVTLMDEQINMLNTSLEYANKLGSETVLGDPSDRLFVDQGTTVMNDLLSMATNLKAYATTNADEDVNAYQTARTSAWSNLETLLGLNEEEEGDE